jgi:hypothetical protein
VSFVAFNVAGPRSLADKLNSPFVGGLDKALPDTYGLSADQLARLMNEWLAEHGGTKSASD